MRPASVTSTPSSPHRTADPSSPTPNRLTPGGVSPGGPIGARPAVARLAAARPTGARRAAVLAVLAALASPSIAAAAPPAGVRAGPGGGTAGGRFQPPGQPTAEPGRPPGPPPTADACQPAPGALPTGRAVASSYPSAPRYTPAGFVATGQPADRVLSAIGFDDAGGGGMFNHPAGIASDGERLVLADRNNNRVLVWTTPPTGDTPADLVLGQPDLTRNAPGAGLDQMSWPTAVSAAGGRLVVADTENHRLLLWDRFPTRSGQPADRAIAYAALSRASGGGNYLWPWGVWTDGTRLAAVSTTATPALFIWHAFPDRSDALPDLVVRDPRFGTPRHITSDGTRLMIWDHNARFGDRVGRGTFVWHAWPATADAAASFLADYQAVGAVTAAGGVVAAGDGIMVWHAFPATAADRPDLQVRAARIGSQDGLGVALVGGRVYALDGNGNRIVGYHAVPTSPDQAPDFYVGSDGLCHNSLDARFIVTNPVPATDGDSLFVSSDFDRKLYVWRSVPDRDAAFPDWVYALPFQPWDNTLARGTLALAGDRMAMVWSRPPTAGEAPSAVFDRRIGGVAFERLRGVALDDRYFYLADEVAGKVYGWRGVPAATDDPAFTLDVGPAIARIESDGRYLTVVTNATGGAGPVRLYAVDRLEHGADPITVRGGGAFRFNMPGGAMTIGERLLVADTGFGRVLGWDRVADAAAGAPPTLILGATRLDDVTQEIGREKLFWPAALAFDGLRLWVGEFKFSQRLLRYDVPRSDGGAASPTPATTPAVEPTPTPAGPAIPTPGGAPARRLCLPWAGSWR